MPCIPGGNGLSNKPSSGTIPLVDINNGKDINSVLCSFLLNTHFRGNMPKQAGNRLCFLGAVFERSVPCPAIPKVNTLQCQHPTSPNGLNTMAGNKIWGSSEKEVQTERGH